MASIEDFSETQEIDDPICACQQGNLFYLDMPQEVQGNLNLSFAVNGERTPVLTAETPYRHLNTREGTAGALQCYIQGREHTLISDLSEAGSIGSPEDLKVVVGTERPSPTDIARYNRLERVKQLIRNDGRVTQPVTTMSRIERLETLIRNGVADNEHQDELLQIMRRVEGQTGEHYLIPSSVDIVAIEMSPQNAPPDGQYDIESVPETILDRIGNTILGAFDESFDSLIGYLEAGRDFGASQLPSAILEYVGARQILQNMADSEANLMRSMGGVRNFADQNFMRAIRTNPAAREAFKRAFIKALLRQKVVKIQVFPNSRTILSFKTHARIRMSFGIYNVRGTYRSSLFEASGRVSGGRFASVAGDAFRGPLAAIGVVLVVVGEVKSYFDTPEAERSWATLMVGLGVEMVKVAISAIAGAMLAAALVAAGLIGGPLWIVIGVGAVLSMAVGVAIGYVDESLGVKRGIQNAVNSVQPLTRHGESIRW